MAITLENVIIAPRPKKTVPLPSDGEKSDGRPVSGDGAEGGNDRLSWQCYARMFFPPIEAEDGTITRTMVVVRKLFITTSPFGTFTGKMIATQVKRQGRYYISLKREMRADKPKWSSDLLDREKENRWEGYGKLSYMDFLQFLQKTMRDSEKGRIAFSTLTEIPPQDI